MPSLAVAMVAVLAALAGAPAASADPPSVTIEGVRCIPGDAFVEVALAIPKGIDTAAHTGNANWDVQLTVTYNSVNNDIQIFDTGPLPIKDNTVLLRALDTHTDLVRVDFPLGIGLGNNPSCQTTAQLLRPGGG